jgi:hypothetical protein
LRILWGTNALQRGALATYRDRLEGVSESQFVRDSAYARALFVLIDRNTNSAEVRRLMISLAKRTQEPELVRLTQLLLTD